MKKPEEWGVKALFGDPNILHPAECNFHTNIPHLRKVEK